MPLFFGERERCLEVGLAFEVGPVDWSSRAKVLDEFSIVISKAVKREAARHLNLGLRRLTEAMFDLRHVKVGLPSLMDNR